MGLNRLNWWMPALSGALFVGVWSSGAAAQGTPAQVDRPTVQRTAVQRNALPKVAVARDPAVTAAAVQAARERAIENLYGEVSSLPLTSRMTVGQYVQYMESREEMLKGLSDAEQIGGPRWLDETTVQVSLEIPATRVGGALKRIAASKPNVTPVRVDQIEWAQSSWQRRTYAANGASMGSRGVVDVRPQFSARWQGVGDEAREKVLAAATTDAVNRAMEGVAPVRLVGRQTIGEGFAIAPVGERVRDWLSTRPVTQVDFREDGELYVEMVLAVNEVDYLETVRGAFAGQDRVAFPQEEPELKRVEREFYANFRPAIGRAGIEREAPANVNVRQGFALPNREPDWVEQRVSVEGSAPFKVTQASAVEKLRVMGKAEQDAAAKLRERIENLPLAGSTVGEAAKQDPRIEAAVRRALGRAEFSRSSVRVGESAVAEMSLDLKVLWSELRR